MKKINKIFITGGSGFIGTNFINLISKKKFKIFNIDKLSNVSTPEKFKIIKNQKKYFFKKDSLNSVHQIFKYLNFFKPDLIINFAAESHVDRSIDDPVHFIKNNVESSLNLFHSYVKYSKTNKVKLIHISTDEVYGSVPAGLSKETHNFNPSSPYSASKASLDLIAKSFNTTYKTNIRVINLSNNYGPYQFPEKLIPTLIFHFLKNKPAPIYGRGENIREWTHVEDSSKAILKTSLSNKKFFNINIGSGKKVSNIKIARIIFGIMKKRKLTKLTNQNFLKMVKDRPGHDVRYALNTNLFKNKINYQFKKDLKSGLNETISWYISNNKWLKSCLKKYKYNRLGLID